MGQAMRGRTKVKFLNLETLEEQGARQPSQKVTFLHICFLPRASLRSSPRYWDLEKQLLQGIIMGLDQDI